MSKLEEKIKMLRTRPATFLDEEVHIRVYSAAEWEEIAKKLDKMSDKQTAKFISEQVLDGDGKPLLSPEFLTSRNFKQCIGMELMNLISDVNAGVHALKNSQALLKGIL